MSSGYPKIAQLKTVAALRAHLDELGWELPIDDQLLAAGQQSPLDEPLDVGGFRVTNRWCIHPMEGWDANADGTSVVADAAPVGKLRPQRRQVDLGWRGSSCAARRARESQPIARHGGPRSGIEDVAGSFARRPSHGGWEHRGFAGRSPTDPLGPLLPPPFQSTRAETRVSPSAAGSQVRHCPYRSRPGLQR